MSNVNENALDSQRSSEDSDLLERSTRKRKVSDEATGNATVTPAEYTPLEKLSPAAVDVVAEMPTDEPNRSAMQIETDGVFHQDAVPVSGAGMEPPAPIAEALPRSYLDSVVGSGAGAAPFLMASLSDEDDAADLSGDDDLERRQPAQTSGPSTRAPVGGAGTERGAVGSRYAPLETEDGSGAVPEIVAQTLKPNRAGDQTNNLLAEGRTGTHLEKEQASRRHIASGSGSRRAAEEDEHVVVRGENGGQVVNSTRVNNGDSPVMAPVVSTELSQEHHTDPPDALDVEGDVVMEIEDPKGDNQMEVRISLRGSIRKDSWTWAIMVQNLLGLRPSRVVSPKVPG
nr:uncharacterized protein LOC109156749 [Ipomoea batatas]